MHTAEVSEWGQSPRYVEVADHLLCDSESTQIKVQATALHALVRARAAGTHYSSTALPHVPGTDGVGTTADGQAVYFSTFASGGSFSDIVNVPNRWVAPLPAGVDPLQAAAFMNPGLSSWMAMKKRAQNLPSNFSVLIMGVTSASGVLAVSLARALGAGAVVGCARNATAMAALDLDDTIQLQTTASETDFSKAAGVDLILDYVYGPPTEHLLKTIKVSKPLQYIHIGSLAAPEISLPGAVLRSKNITIRGSGPGAFSHEELDAEIPHLLEAFKDVRPYSVRVVPLSDVEKVWSEKGDRTVFVP